MRRRVASLAALAASFVLLAGCAVLPPGANETDSGAQEPAPSAAPVPAPTTAPSDAPAASEAPDESADDQPPGSASQGGIDDIIFVVANSNTWRVELLEVGPANLDELVMYDSGAAAEAPGGREELVWVCFTAVQTSGYPGTAISDDFRFEIWATDGTRYDHLTAIDYAMAEDDQDLYYAQGHDLDVPYEGVCALFIVPRGLELTQVMIVPDNGDPVELDLPS